MDKNAVDKRCDHVSNDVVPIIIIIINRQSHSGMSLLDIKGKKKKETFLGVDKIIRCDGGRIRIVGHVKVAMAI